MQRSSSQVRSLDPQQACECLSDQPRLFAVGGCRGLPRLPIVLQAAALVMVGVQQIAAWVPVLLDTLAVRYRANPATARSVAAKSRKLLRYLISAGDGTWGSVTPEMSLSWCWAASPDQSGRYRDVSAGTARMRAWVAGALLEAAESLGAGIDANRLRPRPISQQPSMAAMRPLTEAEARLVRANSRSGIIATTLPVLVGLAFAGASASEIARVAAAHIDADRGFVRLSGDRARVNPIDEWARTEIAFHLRNRTDLDPHAPLCISAGLTLDRATHSVTVRLRRVLVDAGISHRRGVTARSIRYTTAHRICHAHGIVAAARFLGARSLDDTAAVFARALPEGPCHG